ncbi:unnamed protein product [Heligmosomoides polygyrus]|uniref:AN1-type domain-containing protein n=1 Tax=Heligmosomoides polygyrus TaxID=6339 RepID=A0A183FU92_HELPZ|nr:unnamed protein product [Heligmosomoides polygyrus]
MGRHYTDACQDVRSASERRRMMELEGRCLICPTFHHETTPCAKKSPCFYCRVGSKCKDEHHTALCPKPEERERKMKDRSS